jgi:hypothetical protein
MAGCPIYIGAGSGGVRDARSLGERVLTDEPGRRTFCVIGVTPRRRYTTETSPQSGRYAAFLVSRQISDGNLCLGFRS